MRIHMPIGKDVLALLAIMLIAFGCTGLSHAQGTQGRQVIRLGFDGAYLGIEMEEVTTDNMAKYRLSSEAGVIVRSVEKGSPAEAARLQENDVILEYSGVPVLSVASLTRLVQETPVNRTVALAVSRDGKRINLSAKLAERRGAQTLAERAGILIDRDNLLRRFELSPLGSGAFNFAIPRSGARILGVTPNRPQLGITVESLTEQMATFLGAAGKKGVLVNTVNAGSPAAAVLKAGDVILSIDQKPVAAPADLTQAMAKKEPGSKVELRIIRDKKEMSVTAELPKSAASRGGVIL